MAGPHLLAARPDSDENGEDHHCHAVVEQRLTGDDGLQPARNTGTPQDGEARDGIGGGDERAEGEGSDEADGLAHRGREPPEGEPHECGGDQDPEGGKECDDPLRSGQVLQVEMERTGEEQEGQHSLHQCLVEMDTREEPLRLPVEVQSGPSEQEEREGRQERDGHDADGRRQPDEAVIRPAEDRSERDHHCGDVEERHGGVLSKRAGRDASSPSSLSGHPQFVTNPSSVDCLGRLGPVDTKKWR